MEGEEARSFRMGDREEASSQMAWVAEEIHLASLRAWNVLEECP